MKQINRRDFMRQTARGVAGTMAGAWALGAFGAAEEGAVTRVKATTLRKLGKTGLEPTLVGMGTGVRGWNGSSALTRKGHDSVMATLRHAYERGITYFDLADMYGSHPYMKEALKGGIPRDKVTLLTKAVSRDPEFMRNDIERFRKELDTDRLDIVLMHCITDRDGPNWPEKLKPCMDVLAEAKTKGIVRAHGCSCHSLAAMKLAAECPWVDVILARINPFGEKMDGPPEEVAPVLKKAHEAGKGILGMKIVGEGALKDKIPQSLKFVLGLGCVDAMPIGFLGPEEVDSFIAHVDAAAKA